MTEERKGVDGSGPAARRARRNLVRAQNRRNAKLHGAPLPDPDQTKTMDIPEHIRALADKVKPPEEKA